MCAHRKSETLEAFQALEEGRVERLDGKTPVPPSKGRLARRQSSPSLPREVRLPAWRDHIPTPQAGLLFPTTFSFISATCFSLPLLPLPDILSPPSVTHQDTLLLNGSSPFILWVQEASLQYSFCARGCNCCLVNYLTKLSPSPNPILFLLTGYFFNYYFLRGLPALFCPYP